VITPPVPAEAFAFSSAHQMTPNLLFYPVLHITETPAGMADPKVVDPTSQNRVDQFDHPVHGLGLKATEDLLELVQKCGPRLHLRRYAHSPLTSQGP
jgi:hypothetical protein